MYLKIYTVSVLLYIDFYIYFFLKQHFSLFQAAMNEPLFNSLRTEKQLAYSVHCNPSIMYGVLGFTIVIESQANKFMLVLKP